MAQGFPAGDGFQNYAAAASPKPTPWGKYIAIGCGAVALVFVLICGGLIAWVATLPEGGVRTANNMEQYALDYIADKGLLNPDESIIAYYDVTIGMNGTEAAILTDQRLIYHAPSGDIVFQLDEIDTYDHRNEPFIGDIIDVYAKDGRMMAIEIAPLNDGQRFLNALEKQLEQQGN